MLTKEVIILCLKIFFSRILDVSLGTLCTIFTVKGKSKTASLIGFVQIMIWFLAVRTAFNSSEGGLLLAIFYAGGYAVGTYVGGILAKKLIKGTANVQIVSSTKDDKLVNAIRDAGFGISVVNVNPSQFGGEKYMIFAEVDTKRIEELRSLIYSIDSKAFITVQETKIVYNGFIK
ncbi:MAG: DUF2179 domain-containing protein [Oscillospiraceae bacterium]|nr:DUF2179 domain-containing protein [Oscillospiraceae bacterium]MBQ4239941.1 DUF2179 domain-containing protein [Oscillospiraceae bacterium]